MTDHRLYPDRRQVIGGLAVGAIAGLAPAAEAQPSALRFLAVGDWGRDGASHQRDVAAQMGRTAQAIDARFILSVGDNFYENGVASTQDPQWKTSFEEVYVAAALQRPWYVTLGNHDHRGSPQAQIDYSATSPRWRMPSAYFKVSGAELGFPDLDLFGLDTTPIVSPLAARATGDAQLAWLDAELARSTAPWKLVFGHHTTFSGGDHGNTGRLVDDLKPLLERHGVQAYLNGHDHDLQHIEVDGVSYICTGAGSETRPVKAIAGTKFCLSRSGFTAYELTARTLTVTFRDYEGQALHQAVIPQRRAA